MGEETIVRQNAGMTLLEVMIGVIIFMVVLGATEIGLGGCMIAAVDREKLHQVQGIPNDYEIALVLALGVPAEEVVIDDLSPGDNIEYWRDERDRHHVPKRILDTLILNR